MDQPRTAAALIAVGSLMTAPAFAQPAAEQAEIVVTAPLEGAQIESLQGAAILRRDEIIETLNGGLGDTLDAQPGIASTSFGAGASRPIIRGLGEDRVRVLQNGIGAIDASTASPDHAVTSDGLDAERIEVLRGAAALAYGGNAIGGVVNVIDQSIPTRAVDGVEGEALAAFSSVDDGRQGALSFGAGAGPFALSFSAARRETDPYEIPGAAALHHEHEDEEDEEEEHHEEAEGVAPNTWTEFESYNLGGSFVGDWGFIGVAAKHTEGEYGLLGHAHDHEHEEEEDEEEGEEHEEEPNLSRLAYEQTRYEARGDLRIDAGPFDGLDFAVQQSDYEHTEFEADGEAGTRFFSEGWEGRLEAHHRGEIQRGALGVQFSDIDFSAEGEEAFVTATNTQDIGVFAVERLDYGQWGLEGGLRFERREIDNVTFGGRDFDNVSGSLGVFVRPAENWFLAATLAHTERAPTAFELFSDGPHLATANYELGDPTLDQEQALSFEVSARYSTGPLRFEVNIFRAAFSDYIALVERGDVWWLDEETETSGFAPDADDAGIPEEAEILPVFNFVQQDATFTGGEFSLSALLFEAGSFSFRGDAAFDIVNAEFDGGGHPPRIPPTTLTLGLEAESEHWNGRIEMVDVGAQNDLAPFETPTEGYTLLNAGLAFRPFGEDGALTFRIDGRNLTDEEARAHASFLKDELPLPGRNVRFTVLTRF